MYFLKVGSIRVEGLGRLAGSDIPPLLRESDNSLSQGPHHPGRTSARPLPISARPHSADTAGSNHAQAALKGTFILVRSNPSAQDPFLGWHLVMVTSRRSPQRLSKAQGSGPQQPEASHNYLLCSGKHQCHPAWTDTPTAEDALVPSETALPCRLQAQTPSARTDQETGDPRGETEPWSWT